MKANIKLIRKNRKYSEEFKRDVVKDFESGRYSVNQLGKLHGIKAAIIYRWIYKYSNFNEKGYRVIEMSKSQTEKIKALYQRIADLERLVGQKQIKIDFLEELIEVAKEEFDIDIKKKDSTSPSEDSGKSEKK